MFITKTIDHSNASTQGDSVTPYVRLRWWRVEADRRGDQMTTTKIASSKLKPPQDIWQACRYGDVKAVQYFVEQKGADVNQPDVFLETPLTYACLAGSTATISYLLQRGAISDPATIAGNRAHHAASSDVPCRWV